MALTQCALQSEHEGRKHVLSESQILGLLETVHDTELQHARAIEERSSEVRTRQFARAIAATHREFLLREALMFEQRGEGPEPGVASRKWQRESGWDLSALREQRSPSIDRTYVDQKCLVYSRLLNLIDRELASNAQSQRIASEVATVRAEVAWHLEEAKALQRWRDAREAERVSAIPQNSAPDTSEPR